MSGSGTEVLTGGPDDDGPVLLASRPRPPWVVAVVAGLVGVVVGVVGAYAVGGAGNAAKGGPQPSASASSDPGVIVPEVVDAPFTASATTSMPPVPGSVCASTPGSLRYDYRLEGAVWLAPDGTVRTGRPSCTSANADVPQRLQVAVVHARAVDGGPNADRVVWYRCASQLPG
jgi:hypothetical protein